MIRQTISLSFSGLSDSNFENKAQFILQSLTGNEKFPEPAPTLKSLDEASVAYSKSLVNAAGLGRIAVAEKNKCRKLLEALLVLEGNYVIFMAQGDVPALTSSGYTLVKLREKRILTNPGNVLLTNGITSGSIVAKVPTVKAAGMYLFQSMPYQASGEGIWSVNPTSKSTYTFENLIPGQQYLVKVAAVGRNDQMAYSPVSSMFAQ